METKTVIKTDIGNTLKRTRTEKSPLNKQSKVINQMKEKGVYYMRANEGNVVVIMEKQDCNN